MACTYLALTPKIILSRIYYYTRSDFIYLYTTTTGSKMFVQYKSLREWVSVSMCVCMYQFDRTRYER